MTKDKNSLGSSMKSLFALIAIPLCIVVGYTIYFVVLGNPSNFSDPATHKGAQNFMGLMYTGGPLVGLLISFLLIVLTFAIERILTIARASGKGSTDNFMREIRSNLGDNKIDEAIAACDRQQGSLANVVRAGLLRYKQVFAMPGLDKDQKLAAIQKELEEATTLELPMLEKNLVIIATIASIATLTGLLGTVIGMIKAFSALAQAGAPDAVALANGIAEALWNTALGIGTSAISIILYNYFTSRIDSLTYKIDEAGFTIAQTFAENYHENTTAIR
jgi:biopolymer transport protein ExbB